MKTRPDISDAEIQAMMDFDQVLERHRNAKPSGRFTKPVLWITGVLTIAVVGWIAFRPAKIVEPTATPQVDQPVTTPKKIDDAVNAVPSETKSVTQKKPSIIKPEIKPELPAADVYTQAEPLHGYPELYDYFQKELTYPVEALKDSVEGIESVSFVINRNGKPEQIKILNSLGTAFDNEAIRVIGNMPEWKPASLNGKPTPARISMPLTFHIERTQKQP